jgi:hypothetical protein
MKEGNSPFYFHAKTRKEWILKMVFPSDTLNKANTISQFSTTPIRADDTDSIKRKNRSFIYGNRPGITQHELKIFRRIERNVADITTGAVSGSQISRLL